MLPSLSPTQPPSEVIKLIKPWDANIMLSMEPTSIPKAVKML